MTTDDNRTLKQLAQEALDVQSACNLSGVVHSWSRSMRRLCDLLPNLGTADRNAHFVNVLFASKVASLTNSESTDAIVSAYSNADTEVAT